MQIPFSEFEEEVPRVESREGHPHILSCSRLKAAFGVGGGDNGNNNNNNNGKPHHLSVCVQRSHPRRADSPGPPNPKLWSFTVR